MKNIIEIVKIWQDDAEPFFQLEITACSEIITAKSCIYSTNDMIDELEKKLQLFISNNEPEVFWQLGEKGDATTPSVSLKFFRASSSGRICVEVYMELDDGGKYSEHNCCFYVKTELGLLEKFYNRLPKLKEPQLNYPITLNELD